MSTTAGYVNAPELAVRTLACAVIKQALSDALDPMTPPDVRRDAEQFLAGDAWFRRWCVAAGMPPVRMITRRHTRPDAGLTPARTHGATSATLAADARLADRPHRLPAQLLLHLRHARHPGRERPHPLD